MNKKQEELNKLINNLLINLEQKSDSHIDSLKKKIKVVLNNKFRTDEEFLNIIQEHDDATLNISNKIISEYNKFIFKLRNNIELTHVHYEILLKIFVNCYDIIRIKILKEHKNIFKNTFLEKFDMFPTNLTKEIEKNLMDSFLHLMIKNHEGSYKFDAYNAIPCKINKIKETYDFIGHSTKNIDIGNNQGTLFFEFTPGGLSRKLYIIKSLSNANSPNDFINYANLIIFYYYIVKCLNDINNGNEMNNKNYIYIMNTELLFIGDGLGIHNLHNKWLFNNIYKKSLDNLDKFYYNYNEYNISNKNFKEEVFNQIGTTIEEVLKYTDNFDFDAMNQDYKLIFKYSHEIYSIIKNFYSFNCESLEKLKFISKKCNISELQQSRSKNNTIINIKAVFEKYCNNIENYKKNTVINNEEIYTLLIEDLNKNFYKGFLNVELKKFNNTEELLKGIKSLSDKIFIKTPTIKEIVNLITFDSGNLFKAFKVNKSKDSLYLIFLKLVVVILNNVHLEELQIIFLKNITKTTQYEPLQDMKNDLLKSQFEVDIDFFKVFYLVEMLYPIMKGKHEYKMPLINILVKYFISNVDFLKLNEDTHLKIQKIQESKIQLILNAYKDYKEVNHQPALFLNDLLININVSIQDLILLYNYCSKNNLESSLMKTIENFIGNTLRNNPFDNKSPFIDRELIQK